MKQYNEKEKILYDKNENNILRVRKYTKKEITTEEEGNWPYDLNSTLYYDLTQFEKGNQYSRSFPLLNVHFEEELVIESIYFIGEDATEEDYVVETIQLEVADFELSDSDELTELEVIIPPIPELDPLDQMKAENKALELRMESLKRQLEEDRRTNEATTLELLELMIGML